MADHFGVHHRRARGDLGNRVDELTDGADAVLEEVADRAVALPASAIAEAIAYAVAQPAQVDVNEIVVRPAASAQ